MEQHSKTSYETMLTTVFFSFLTLKSTVHTIFYISVVIFFSYLFVVEQSEVNEFFFKWHKGDHLESHVVVVIEVMLR